MHHDRPSLTAWAVAVRRAAHQLVDDPLVLDDSLALQLVGRAAVQDSIAKENTQGAVYQRYSRVLRAAVVGRSRFAEDHLAKAVGEGVRQYVVLGAGLDTFGHRNIHEALGLRVFEVDHPATQQWKQKSLTDAGVVSPSSLTFVPVDFEKQHLEECLAESGFDPAAPAFFSWLGVVPYLTLPAFRQTLAYLGQRPAGSQVAFDYATALEDLGIRERVAFDMLAERVKAAGEPFQLFLKPAKMHAELTAAGFTRIEDLNGEALNARYFSGRSDRLGVAGKLGRFLHAVI